MPFNLVLGTENGMAFFKFIFFGRLFSKRGWPLLRVGFSLKMMVVQKCLGGGNKVTGYPLQFGLSSLC